MRDLLPMLLLVSAALRAQTSRPTADAVRADRSETLPAVTLAGRGLQSQPTGSRPAR